MVYTSITVRQNIKDSEPMNWSNSKQKLTGVCNQTVGEQKQTQYVCALCVQGPSQVGFKQSGMGSPCCTEVAGVRWCLNGGLKGVGSVVREIVVAVG